MKSNIFGIITIQRQSHIMKRSMRQAFIFCLALVLLITFNELSSASLNFKYQQTTERIYGLTVYYKRLGLGYIRGGGSPYSSRFPGLTGSDIESKISSYQLSYRIVNLPKGHVGEVGAVYDTHYNTTRPILDDDSKVSDIELEVFLHRNIIEESSFAKQYITKQRIRGTTYDLGINFYFVRWFWLQPLMTVTGAYGPYIDSYTVLQTQNHNSPTQFAITIGLGYANYYAKSFLYAKYASDNYKDELEKDNETLRYIPDEIGFRIEIQDPWAVIF